MCYFNTRDYEDCTSEPKHTYKEVHKCAAAKATEKQAWCPKGEWEQLGSNVLLDNKIFCPICTGIVIIPQGGEAN